MVKTFPNTFLVGKRRIGFLLCGEHRLEEVGRLTRASSGSSASRRLLRVMNSPMVCRTAATA
jgi:hypothetical protein